jgi:hypothetical protein
MISEVLGAADTQILVEGVAIGRINDHEITE